MLKDFVEDYRSRRSARSSSSSGNFKSADNWSKWTANASKADNWSNFNEMIDPIGVSTSGGSVVAPSADGNSAVQPMGLTKSDFSSFVANASERESTVTYFQNHRNAIAQDTYQVAFLRSVHDKTRPAVGAITALKETAPAAPERSADQTTALLETITAVQSRANGTQVSPADAVTIYSSSTITTHSQESSRFMSKRWLRKLAEDTNTPAEALRLLATDPDTEVRSAVADHRNTPVDTLWLLRNDPDADVRYALAENHNVMLELLESLVEDENPYVASRAARTIRRLGGATIFELRRREEFGLRAEAM